MLQPINPIFRHGHKVEGRTDDSKEHCSKSKRRRTSICPPRSPAIDEKAPDEKGDGEYEKKGRVENVSNGIRNVEDFLRAR